MALNDLMSELQKETFFMEEHTERRMVEQIIKLVDDKNGEVQNLITKWCVCFPSYPRIR